MIIVTHELATGFAQYLEEYLIGKKIRNLLYVHHPLHPEIKESKGCGFRLYENGVLKKEICLKNRNKQTIFTYIIDVFQNIYWVIKSRQKWDLYIGANNLNAFPGIFLKKMGLVKKCVFYTVDFVPNRFSNKFLNSVYLWIDEFCVKNCDETWIVSPRMIEGRHDYLNLDKKYDKKQILVPEGVFLKRIEKNKNKEIKIHTAVFVGHLVERIGVQKVIEAIPFIVKKIPDFKFIVIGAGPYEDELKKLSKKLSVEKNLTFTGYIKDHQDVEKIISSCAVGIACYEDSKDSFTYYAEPSKTKIYLGAGLPVVMTDMFYNAHDIEKAGAGKVVKYDKMAIANGILEFINNSKDLENHKMNALKFIKKYDWNLIFKENLERVLK